MSKFLFNCIISYKKNYISMQKNFNKIRYLNYNRKILVIEKQKKN